MLDFLNLTLCFFHWNSCVYYYHGYLETMERSTDLVIQFLLWCERPCFCFLFWFFCFCFLFFWFLVWFWDVARRLRIILPYYINNLSYKWKIKRQVVLNKLNKQKHFVALNFIFEIIREKGRPVNSFEHETETETQV